MSLTSLLASVAASALAQGEVHVHGHGTLTIGVEADGRAEALFEVPAESLWGFEHAPQNDEEQAAIDAALAQLETAGLVTFSSRAGCEQTAVNIDRGDDAHHDDHDHDEHDHGHEDHSHDDHGHEGDAHDHHQHDKMIDHDHDHGDDDHDHGHQDVTVQIVFECTAPEQINSIETTLFDAFPRLETIDGIYVDTARQTAFEFTPSQTSVRLP